MKIEITRSGGFGGLTRSWSLEVSRTEAEQRWLPLAEAEAGGPADGPATGAGAPAGQGQAGAAAASSTAGTSPDVQRDRFTYRIAIGYTEVYVPESQLGDPWRELIERARRAGAADAPSDDTDPGKPRELL